VRGFALLLLAVTAASASTPAVAGTAGARAQTATALAAGMEGSVRMALLRSCGPDPVCGAYAPRAWRGVEPLIAVEGLGCSTARRGALPVRRCGFAIKSPRRDARLTCSAEFHETSGDALASWTDLKLEKPHRVYLPTGSVDAPSTLGLSTLRCSGSLIAYAS
jgi:hypothetical protein